MAGFGSGYDGTNGNTTFQLRAIKMDGSTETDYSGWDLRLANANCFNTGNSRSWALSASGFIQSAQPILPGYQDCTPPITPTTSLDTGLGLIQMPASPRYARRTDCALYIYMLHFMPFLYLILILQTTKD